MSSVCHSLDHRDHILLGCFVYWFGVVWIFQGHEEKMILGEWNGRKTVLRDTHQLNLGAELKQTEEQTSEQTSLFGWMLSFHLCCH